MEIEIGYRFVYEVKNGELYNNEDIVKFLSVGNGYNCYSILKYESYQLINVVDQGVGGGFIIFGKR